MSRSTHDASPAGPPGALTTVQFRGDLLFAYERADGVFVAVKPISTRLGIDWSAQLQRLRRQPILAEGMVVITIPSPGGAQETVLLRLDLLPGWLFGIDANRVAPRLRDAILAYQRECFAVLHAHFFIRAGNREAERAARQVEMAESRRRREALAEDHARLAKVREARLNFGRVAAQRVWAEVGLPAVAFGPDQPDLFTGEEARH